MAYNFIEEYQRMYKHDFETIRLNDRIPAHIDFIRNIYFKCSECYDLKRHKPLPFSLALEWVPSEIDNVLKLFRNYNGSINDFVKEYELKYIPQWL